MIFGVDWSLGLWLDWITFELNKLWIEWNAKWTKCELNEMQSIQNVNSTKCKPKLSIRNKAHPKLIIKCHPAINSGPQAMVQ